MVGSGLEGIVGSVDVERRKVLLTNACVFKAQLFGQELVDDRVDYDSGFDSVFVLEGFPYFPCFFLIFFFLSQMLQQSKP